MKILRRLDHHVNRTNGIVVAVGNFDGVHRGHHKVLNLCRRLSAEHASEAWALTFNPHPQRVVHPETAPPLLMDLDEKLKSIRSLGMDGVLVVPFDQGFAAQEPGQFIATLRNALPTLQCMVVGPNWRFGHNASGTVRTLEELGRDKRFRVEVCQPCLHEDEPISSTRLRQAVQSGRLTEFRDMAGYSYQLSGHVIQGKKVGRELGYPTANLKPWKEVLPPHGVYAVYAGIAGERLPGAGYFGRRNTAGTEKGHDLFETYVFDFQDDLYGRTINVDLLEYIRPDCQFESETALRKQIRSDIETVKTALVRAAAKTPDLRPCEGSL